jgi:hypothetical protein
VILTAFVMHQRHVQRTGGDALVDLALLRARTVSAALIAQLALACAQASFFVYLALYLQDGRGLGPLSAGLVFTAVAIGYVVASAPAPALVERHGRAVAAAGGISLAAALVAAHRARPERPLSTTQMSRDRASQQPPKQRRDAQERTFAEPARAGSRGLEPRLAIRRRRDSSGLRRQAIRTVVHGARHGARRHVEPSRSSSAQPRPRARDGAAHQAKLASRPP